MPDACTMLMPCNVRAFGEWGRYRACAGSGAQARAVLDAASQAASGLKDAASGVLDTLSSSTSGALESLNQATSGALEGATSALKDVSDSVSGAGAAVQACAPFGSLCV